MPLIEQEVRTLIGMLKLYATASRPASPFSDAELTDLEGNIGQMVLRERFGVPMDLQSLNRIWSRAAEGVNHLRDTTVMVAIPGLGKTSYAKAHTEAVDMDYGNWRRRWAASRKDLTPEQYVRVLGIFVLYTLANPATWDKEILFVNELDLIHFYKGLGMRVLVLIPDDEFIPQWLAGIVSRTARQAADELEIGTEILQRFEFCIRAVEQHRIWLQDWQDAASALGIPFKRTLTWLSKLDLGQLEKP